MKSIKTVHEKCVGNHLDPILMNHAACWICLLSCWRKRLYPIAVIFRDFRLRMMINDFRCKGLGVFRIINTMSTGPLPLFVFLRRLMGLVVVFPSQLTQNSDLGKGWQAILVHRPLAAWATGNLAGDIIIGLGAHLFEISEEENILTMDSVERVPDLERLIGIEAAISNRSRGGKARVSEFGIQIEAHQFFLIRAESIARE
ncbi:hypothetical protein OIU79_021145 [Salix purpurea]|uniref:Uncharacterized protein n=1 Tax=Salix purpurea TaxID=77065 RepID=A0A9Q0WQU3_SALPP|nr:hypothetical protein OIU79_021145 [Salix purpurea]